MPAPSTSLITSATSAGTSPRAMASAMAAKFDPLPEPSTPRRNVLDTPLLNPSAAPAASLENEEGRTHCQEALIFSCEPWQHRMAIEAYPALLKAAYRSIRTHASQLSLRVTHECPGETVKK